jgi:transcriptional regulator with XRE-family HTH domain
MIKVRLGDRIADGEKREFISKEEKLKTQEAFMKRLEELIGDMDYRDFAESVGLSGNNIYSYRNGIRFPTAYALKRIAERTGKTVDWLLGG